MTTARILECLEGLDLASADGRAGVATLVAELRRRAPEEILAAAATIQLQRLGIATPR